MVDFDRYEAYEGDDLDWTLKDRIAKIEKLAKDMPELFGRPDNRMAIKGLQDEIKGMELNAEIMAGYEKDKDGKPLYTNAGQRKVGATKILKKDEDYKARLEILIDLKNEQHAIKVDKQVMEGELNILKITIPALTRIYERETLILKIKETKNAE